MASEIQVAPVTGMTPAQVAKELRVLIRDQIWMRVKGGSALGSSAVVDNYKTALPTHRDRLNKYRLAEDAVTEEIKMALTRLEEVSKLRKPSLIRVEVDNIRGRIDSLSNHHRHHDAEGRWFERTSRDLLTRLEAGAGDASLLEWTERAYALVQALPTIDGVAVGKADNTLRAIAAMVKVYYGVDVEGTIENIPGAPIAELFKMLVPAPEEVTPEPELNDLGIMSPNAATTSIDLGSVMLDTPDDAPTEFQWHTVVPNTTD